jgi:hypothetical protein
VHERVGRTRNARCGCQTCLQNLWTEKTGITAEKVERNLNPAICTPDKKRGIIHARFAAPKMKLNSLLCAITTLVAVMPRAHADVAILLVPATANLWLAGQPNGTTLLGDSAPAQSPVNAGVTFLAGSTVTFNAPVGTGDFAAPDGGASLSQTAHFGLSGIAANSGALIGVFINNSVPSDANPAPASLDFSASGLTRDFTTLSPGLNQVFFIGDGKTSGNIVQQFTVPTGATRLFLGNLDSSAWNANTGTIIVNLTYTADAPGAPDMGSSFLLLAMGLAALSFGVIRKRNNSG